VVTIPANIDLQKVIHYKIPSKNKMPKIRQTISFLVPVIGLITLMVMACTFSRSRLYVGSRGELMEEAKSNQVSFSYIYPSPDQNDPTEWMYVVSGDIRGNSYSFNLFLIGVPTAIFQVAIVLQQGGMETVLASGKFETSTDEEKAFAFIKGQRAIEVSEFKLFSAKGSGRDLKASKGDTLLLRISNLASSDGGFGILLSSDLKHRQSFITIPRMTH
jgi:hypothetical protein